MSDTGVALDAAIDKWKASDHAYATLEAKYTALQADHATLQAQLTAVSAPDPVDVAAVARAKAVFAGQPDPKDATPATPAA